MPPLGPPQPQRGFLDSSRDGLSLGMMLCSSWATSLEVFLHKGMGHRYHGLQAAAVLLLVPFYSLAWSEYDLRPLMCFLGAYVVMCLVTRVDGLLRRSRGMQQHSFYSGWPRLMGQKCRIDEVAFKRFVEPVFALLAGYGLRQIDPPLGTYLMIGGVCMFLTVSAGQTVERARAVDMNDAVIEQEWIAERFREMRGRQ